jgi:hypothetical protein
MHSSPDQVTSGGELLFNICQTKARERSSKQVLNPLESLRTEIPERLETEALAGVAEPLVNI